MTEIYQRLKQSHRKFLEGLARDRIQLISDWQKTSPGSTYIVGNSRDFDQFGQFFIDVLGVQCAGAATFWPEVLDVVDPNGRQMFTPGNRYIGKQVIENPDVLFCQSIITSDREVRGMISTVLDLVDVRSLAIYALHITDTAKADLSAYFDDSSELPVRIVAPDIVPQAGSWNLQSKFYERLEEALKPTTWALPKFARDKLRELKKPGQRPGFTI